MLWLQGKSHRASNRSGGAENEHSNLGAIVEERQLELQSEALSKHLVLFISRMRKGKSPLAESQREPHTKKLSLGLEGRLMGCQLSLLQSRTIAALVGSGNVITHEPPSLATYQLDCHLSEVEKV